MGVIFKIETKNTTLQSNFKQYFFSTMELTTHLKDITMLLAFVGTFYVLNFLRRFVCSVWKHLLRPSRNLKQRYASRNKDAWAVITGSALGIGKQYGIEL